MTKCSCNLSSDRKTHALSCTLFLIYLPNTPLSCSLTISSQLLFGAFNQDISCSERLYHQISFINNKQVSFKHVSPRWTEHQKYLSFCHQCSKHSPPRLTHFKCSMQFSKSTKDNAVKTPFSLLSDSSAAPVVSNVDVCNVK